MKCLDVTPCIDVMKCLDVTPCIDVMKCLDVRDRCCKGVYCVIHNVYIICNVIGTHFSKYNNSLIINMHVFTINTCIYYI